MQAECSGRVPGGVAQYRVVGRMSLDQTPRFRNVLADVVRDIDKSNGDKVESSFSRRGAVCRQALHPFVVNVARSVQVPGPGPGVRGRSNSRAAGEATTQPTMQNYPGSIRTAVVTAMRRVGSTRRIIMAVSGSLRPRCPSGRSRRATGAFDLGQPSQR